MRLGDWIKATTAGGAIVAAAMAGCSSSDTTPAPKTCVAGETLCGDQCAETAADPANCGACGNACDTGEVCSQSNCALQCAGGSTQCGQSCFDVDVDRKNCGACGKACNAGEVCEQGKCTAQCAAAQTLCVGDAGEALCVSPQNDHDNCGGCGSVCDPGKVCTGGTCEDTCGAGETLCPGDGGPPVCAATQTDSANCGSCGNACTNGLVCSGGSCVANCGPNEVLCDGDGGAPYCAKTDTDNANCGSCGNVCGQGLVCAAGACQFQCSQGLTKCGNQCVDTDFDRDHCGNCSTTCSGGTPYCANGACTTCSNTVLVLSDTHTATNQAFLTAINAAGLSGTMVDNGASAYAGTPAATNFRVIMLMVGDDYSVDMPTAGQQAIVDAQAQGIGVVFTDWAGYHPYNGRWQTLKSINLYQYTSGSTGALTFTNTVAHPIWTGLPSSFTTTSSMGCSIGTIMNSGTAIANNTFCGGAGVVVRSSPGGRLVYVTHAANYSANTTWVNDANTMKLTINALKWATGCLL